jgi:ubiquitin-conjugating enzyme E2 R
MYRSSAIVKIQGDFKEITQEPLEGVLCQLVDENIFQWKIWFQGPKDSPYEGGTYQILMIFPEDYPMSPPKLKVQNEFWHPNVYYPAGDVCISILHMPGKDPLGYESPEERWMPTQTVKTIILSFCSMLSDPNIESSANVDASIEWTNKRVEYITRCKYLSEKANQLVPDFIISQIPHPDTDETQKLKVIQKLLRKDVDIPFDIYGDEFNENSEEFDENSKEFDENLGEFNKNLEEFNDFLEPEEPINNYSGPSEFDYVDVEQSLIAGTDNNLVEVDKFRGKRKRENNEGENTKKKRKISNP